MEIPGNVQVQAALFALKQSHQAPAQQVEQLLEQVREASNQIQAHDEACDNGSQGAGNAGQGGGGLDLLA